MKIIDDLVGGSKKLSKTLICLLSNFFYQDFLSKQNESDSHSEHLLFLWINLLLRKSLSASASRYFRYDFFQGCLSQIATNLITISQIISISEKISYSYTTFKSRSSQKIEVNIQVICQIEIILFR